MKNSNAIIIEGTRLSTAHATAANAKVQEATFGTSRDFNSAATQVVVGFAAHVREGKTRVRAVAQLKMSVDAAWATLAELHQAIARAEEANKFHNEEGLHMPADIIVRDANNVVQPTQYEYFDDAVNACPAGGSITLAPRHYTTRTPTKTYQITKRITIRGTTATAPKRMLPFPMGGGSPRTSTLCWRSDEGSMIRIRNGNDGIGVAGAGDTIVADSGVVLRDLVIAPDRSQAPGTGDVWQRPNAPIDALRIQAGDIGTKTRVDLYNVIIENAAGGIAQELVNPAHPNTALVVNATDVTIRNIYSVRNADGSKPVQNGSNWHAQGWYTTGGLSTRTRVKLQNIGSLPGSTIYTDSNKEQGFYDIGGEIWYNNCEVDYVGHCGEQCRGATVHFNGFVVRNSPMGVQIGHKQEDDLLPGQGVGNADGSGIQVYRPRAFIDTNGLAIISAGLVIDACETVTLSDVFIDGQGGTFGGGWGGFHTARVAGAFINITDVTVRNWAVGLLFDEPIYESVLGGASEANFENFTVEQCATPFAYNWPNAGRPDADPPEPPQPAAAIGGEWTNLNIDGGMDPTVVRG